MGQSPLLGVDKKGTRIGYRERKVIACCRGIVMTKNSTSVMIPCRDTKKVNNHHN